MDEIDTTNRFEFLAFDSETESENEVSESEVNEQSENEVSESEVNEQSENEVSESEVNEQQPENKVNESELEKLKEEGWTTVGKKKKKKKPTNEPSDKILVCTWCKIRFIFSIDDQEAFSKMNFDPPKRCKECNRKRKQRRRELDAKKRSEQETDVVTKVINEDGKNVVVQTI